VFGSRGVTRVRLALGLLVAVGVMPPLTAGAAGPAWVTDHFDNARSGNDGNDPELAGTPVASWTSPTVDGQIYGEPLYLNGLVYVATQKNSIYAFDANSGNLRWSLLSLMPSVPLAEVHTETGTNCGNIDPMGIIGTPVIDPSLGSAGTLFAVAETYSGSANSNSIEHRLVAIDLGSHAVSSRNIDPPTFTAGSARGLEQERGALNIANGEVIVPYGGMAGDCGSYHGFVVSALENPSTQTNQFEVDPHYTHGGIWAASGAAVDGSGNVYVSTGNGSEPSNAYDLSDGVMKLPPTLGQPPDTMHYFAPNVWSSDNTGDKDLGSMTPTIIPWPGHTNLIFQTGKQNIGFLLDSSNLGGVGGQLFPPLATESTTGHVCDGEARGGTTYAAPYVYVPCTEGIRALTVNTAANPPTFVRSWQGPSDASGPPIMAGGRVWVHGTNKVYGLNAATGATEVNLAVNTPYNFGSPSAGGGNLFYAAGTAVVAFRAAAGNYFAAIGSDESVWDKRDPGLWNHLGGTSTAAPAVVALPSGSGHSIAGFIATATDGDLVVRSEAGGWQPLDFNGSVVCLDNPAAVIVAGTLWVACVGADHTLWAGSATLSGTGLPQVDRASWHSLDGILVAGPAVASVSGVITYFAEGVDHRLYTRTETTGYAQTPWFCNGHPAASAQGSTSYFACQGLDSHLWYATNGGSGWGPAQQLGGILVDGPGVAAAPGGTTIYVEGLDGSVWQRTAGNGWVQDGGVVQKGLGASYIP
jgi:hypothetical protein